ITALNIVGFPDDELSLDILQGILNGGGERVQAAGAVLVGGHSVRDTEIKYGLSATGVVDPERMMSNRQAKAGDHLVLTKALGTGFITTAHRARHCPEDVLETACAGMIQLNQKASQLAVELGARGATDVTGFGLAGHAFEMAEASGVTVRIHLDHLPRLPGASELAQRGYHSRANQSNRKFVEPSSRIEGQPDEIDLQFLFDPQTSGGLLIALDPDSAEQLVARCREEGLADTTLIGEVLGKEKVTLVID
ncbi:MAG: selenide, water dikinase SelD, partial [Phycisphaerae bacterium]|nr:selenide, water dikinase SelD [Phycisphaerae bacterium]